ncbi:Rhodanese-like domain-containing protein [Methanococcoides vulcani]|uniref:Rhodanese-like domain-containing protein n=1 Tax=Methanococcoides vulcani TaxID=1353158 RepID=A0A1H9Z8W5_9EURY|nr:rhodanese-like domain-containing protein [Methanococcoides vulcani]SES77987.1 Rhodanese-like domain-containing protein [Methanococcoides vulcani]
MAQTVWDVLNLIVQQIFTSGIAHSSYLLGGHIQNAIIIPVHKLRDSYKELDPDAKTVVICGSRHRSSMGASILQQKGFSDVYNVSGGMTGYNAAGFGPDCPLCAFHGYLPGKARRMNKKVA